jgi:hypothetical protein
MNWRAKPLVNYRVIVDLISATTTETGLTVGCELDTNRYPKGVVVTDEEMAALDLVEIGTTCCELATNDMMRLFHDGPLASCFMGINSHTRWIGLTSPKERIFGRYRQD